MMIMSNARRTRRTSIDDFDQHFLSALPMPISQQSLVTRVTSVRVHLQVTLMRGSRSLGNPGIEHSPEIVLERNALSTMCNVVPKLAKTFAWY